MGRSAPTRRPTRGAAPPPAPVPRSPLLRPLPRPLAPGRTGRIVRRLVAWASLLGGLIWLIRAVRAEALGTGPVAEALYWSHDALYLPLKGYTYTLFFPASLVWYGVLATISGIWLCFYLADRSWVRRPHLALLRLAVVARPLQRPLVGGARLLARLGFPPDQQLIVAEHERDLSLIRLAAAPDDTGAARRLVGLTRLIVALRLLSPGRHPALQAAADWQSALLLLSSCGAKAQAAKLARPDLARSIFARALGPGGLSPLALLRRADDSLDVAGLLADLLRQAALTGLDLAALAEPGDPSPPPPEQLLHRMLRAAELRRRAVDQLRGQFELLLVRGVAGRAGIQPLAPDAAADELPFLGLLSLRSALAAAVAAEMSEIAGGTLESFEALALTLAMLPADLASAELAHSAELARAWLGELPAPSDYQLAAGLAADDLAARELPWADYLGRDEPVISPAEAGLARARVEGLFQAAGDAHGTNPRQRVDTSS